MIAPDAEVDITKNLRFRLEQKTDLELDDLHVHFGAEKNHFATVISLAILREKNERKR